MDGSPRSKARSSRSWVLALLAAIALIAAACSGDDDSVDSATADTAAVTAEAPETTSAAAEVTDEVDEADAADAVDQAKAEAIVDDAEEAEAEVDESADEAVDETEADDSADEANAEAEADSAATSGMAQVLALAAENSGAQSYSFTQGMAMRMNMLGQDMEIAPEGAYVFGEVENGMVHLNMDMGMLLSATFSSLGIDVTQPPFDEMFGALGDASIEMWSDESAIVMDMSSFANSIGSLDPEQGAELSEFADGPVLIDLTQVDGVDAADVANQFGQGAQVIDPAEILSTLQGADVVSETGASQVNGVDVRVFTAAVSFADYAEAMGVDLTDQLATVGMDGATSASDEAIADAMLPAMEQLMVNMEIMVDGDDLVRRIEIELDMGAVMTTMFTDPEVLQAMADEEGITVEELEGEMAMMGMLDGMELVTTTWQEFDNYGESFDIVLPDAVDVTSELDLAS